MTTRRLLPPLLAIAGILGCAGGSGGDPEGEVAMFRGGASHPGAYPATLGPALVGVQWRVETDGEVAGSVSVLGDTAWVGSSDGTLRALALDDGSVRWAAPLGAPITSTPAIAGGLVAVTTRDGRLHVVDAHSGAERWSASSDTALAMPWGHESGDRYTPSPAIGDGLVVWAAADGKVRANDLDGGRLRWTTATGGAIWGSPAIADGAVYVGSTDGRLYALALGDGAVRWSFRTEGADLHSANFGFDRRTLQSSPAAGHGLVYVGARDGFLYAVHTGDGSLAWRVDHKVSWVIGSPAVGDSTVYVGSSDAQFVQALDATTGVERWRTMLHNIVWSSPAISGDLLLVGDGAGHLHALDRATGTIRWTHTVAAQVHSSPVPAGRLVLFGALDGGVYALCTGDAPPTRLLYADTLGNRPALTALLAARGYQSLDDDGLVKALQGSSGDPARTTLVIAAFQLPAGAVTRPLAQSPFRHFLDAGGTIVWTGMPPLIWPLDSVGQPVGLDGLQWDAPGELLGIPYGKAIFDRRRATATTDGEHWGLRGHWLAGWGIDTAGVTTVLARDAWGLAAAWQKRYGGPAGTGFVVAPGDDPEQLYQVAEHRPACGG